MEKVMRFEKLKRVRTLEFHPIPPSRTRFSPRFLPSASLKCSLPGLHVHSFKLYHFTLVCSTEFFFFWVQSFRVEFSPPGGCYEFLVRDRDRCEKFLSLFLGKFVSYLNFRFSRF